MSGKSFPPVWLVICTTWRLLTVSPVPVAIEDAGSWSSPEETLLVKSGCTPCAITKIAVMRRNNPAMRHNLVMPVFTGHYYPLLIIKLPR